MGIWGDSSRHPAACLGRAHSVKPRFVLAPAVAPQIKLGSLKLVTSKTVVFNPELDAETQMLVAFFAGRSASDCGEMVNWVWNGREFHVDDFRLMTKCEGIPASGLAGALSGTRPAELV